MTSDNVSIPGTGHRYFYFPVSMLAEDVAHVYPNGDTVIIRRARSDSAKAMAKRKEFTTGVKVPSSIARPEQWTLIESAARATRDRSLSSCSYIKKLTARFPHRRELCHV